MMHTPPRSPVPLGWSLPILVLIFSALLARPGRADEGVTTAAVATATDAVDTVDADGIDLLTVLAGEAAHRVLTAVVPDIGAPLAAASVAPPPTLESVDARGRAVHATLGIGLLGANAARVAGYPLLYERTEQWLRLQQRARATRIDASSRRAIAAAVDRASTSVTGCYGEPRGGAGAPTDRLRVAILFDDAGRVLGVRALEHPSFGDIDTADCVARALLAVRLPSGVGLAEVEHTWVFRFVGVQLHLD